VSALPPPPPAPAATDSIIADTLDRVP
jgi:hypothetical protein